MVSHTQVTQWSTETSRLQVNRLFQDITWAYIGGLPLGGQMQLFEQHLRYRAEQWCPYLVPITTAPAGRVRPVNQPIAVIVEAITADLRSKSEPQQARD
jgi:hypothetical protein